MSTSDKILIVGAGTFGLSTALDLARKGYTNVACFDKYENPSPIAAGNDSNKMVDYDWYHSSEKISPADRMRIEAKDSWATDPVFSPYYHPVGFIYAACSEEVLQAAKERAYELKEKGFREYEYLDTPEKFAKHIPVLTGKLPGWRGFLLNEDDGWLHARNSLQSAYQECKKLGVSFVFGDDGEITSLQVVDGALEGIVAKSGKIFKGDKVVLAAGANAVSVFDFKLQLQAKGFTLAHIKVTSEEAETFKNQPVMFNVERGFFFEPDENNEIKICNEFPGYTHLNDKGDSIPFFTDEIPLEAEMGIRQYLQETLPEYADRPFVKTRTCWCTDSPDRKLILDQHPEYRNLILASGDSGMAFMLMPVIGKYVSKLVTGEGLTAEDRAEWKWRPETSATRDDAQDRFGGEGTIKDIRSIKKWVSASNSIPHALDLQ